MDSPQRYIIVVVNSELRGRFAGPLFSEPKDQLRDGDSAFAFNTSTKWLVTNRFVCQRTGGRCFSFRCARQSSD